MVGSKPISSPTIFEQGTLDFIRDCVEKYERSKLALLSSFGKDSMVLLDLVRKVDSDLPVIWIRTPFLPEETIELAGKVTDQWDLNLVIAENEKANDGDFMEIWSKGQTCRRPTRRPVASFSR